MATEESRSERPRLNLKPRDPNAAKQLEAERARAGHTNPFGAAKPRELVIAERTGKTEEEVLKEAIKKERPKLRLNAEQLEQRSQAEARVTELRGQLQEAAEAERPQLQAELGQRESELEELLDHFEALALQAAQRGEIQRPSERRQQQQEGAEGGGSRGGRGGYERPAGYDGARGGGRGGYDRGAGDYERPRGNYDREGGKGQYERGEYDGPRGDRGGRGGDYDRRGGYGGGRGSRGTYERPADAGGSFERDEQDGGRAGAASWTSGGERAGYQPRPYNDRPPRGGYVERDGAAAPERGDRRGGGGSYERVGGRGGGYDREDGAGAGRGGYDRDGGSGGERGYGSGADRRGGGGGGGGYGGYAGGRGGRGGGGGRGYDAYEDLTSTDYVSPYTVSQDRF